MKTARILCATALTVFLMNGQTALGQWTESGNVVYTTNLSNNVGIGLANPTRKLHIFDDQPAGSSFLDAMLVERVFSNSSTTLQGGLTSQVDFAGGSGTTAILTTGMHGIAKHSGTGTITQARGLISTVWLASSGGITDARGLIVNFAKTGTGTIGTGYGIDLTDVPATTGYAIYQRGGDDINYFAGNVGIGTTSPSQLLHVFHPTLNNGLFVESGDAKVSIKLGDPTGQTHITSIGNKISLSNNLGAEMLTADSATGNVGIGTTSPGSTLTVQGGFRIETPSDPDKGLGVGYNTTGAGYVFLSPFDVGAGEWINLAINAGGGNVGIGTTTPSEVLHVFSSSTVANLRIESSAASNVGIKLVQPDQQWKIQNLNPQDSFRIRDHTAGTDPFEIEAGASDNALYINSSGNIGIGTTTLTHTLTVNGNITTEEVEVVPDVPADFVFEDDYALRSLEEVEQYIEAHGHLPEIPSAAEMQAEGVGLSAMQMKLLQKIEELTLYLIEQQKQIAELEKSNVLLQEHLSSVQR